MKNLQPLLTKNTKALLYAIIKKNKDTFPFKIQINEKLTSNSNIYNNKFLAVT